MHMMNVGVGRQPIDMPICEITREEIVDGINRRLASCEKLIGELEAAIPDNAPDVTPILRDEMAYLREARDEMRYVRDHFVLDKAHRVSPRQLLESRRDTLPLKTTVEDVIRRGREPLLGAVIGREVA
jgi:hypothetical protein